MVDAALRLPFHGDYPVTLGFGSHPENPEILEKFNSWGIAGHHGLDFALPEGTPVVASDSGVIKEARSIDDYGNTVVIEHSWGESWYAHLREVRVTVGQEVSRGDVIALSGQTGASFGPHLHFAIKPLDPDPANGFLGFVDPAPFFVQTNEALPELPHATGQEEVAPPFQQVLQEKLTELRVKAHESRRQKREQALMEILKLSETTPIRNALLQEHLGISRQTASNYTADLVSNGKLEKHGKGRGTHYLRIF